MAEAESLRDIEKLAREKEDPKTTQSKATRNNVCKAFLHYGVCKNQSNCPFSHDIKRIKICEHFNRGNCNKGDDCDFRHDASVCNFFRIKGVCKNGTECGFKHIKNICKFFEKGFCPKGDECTDHHEFKTPCMNYLYGFCPLGPNCQYAHPKQFMTMDEITYQWWNTYFKPTFPVIKCNKCKEVGHKANKCNKEVIFKTKATKTDTDMQQYNNNTHDNRININMGTKKLKS